MSSTKRRILVVDDEASFTRLLKLNLEQTGLYEVLAMNAPDQAVSAARRFKPELILLDVMMPEMDGGTLASDLRASPSLGTVPIIFLTAAVKKEEVTSRRGHIGGLPFIAKPIDLAELLECLKEYLPEKASP
jgi:CheY-like chemotaxis protein